jgi:hypothetical protein
MEGQIVVGHGLIIVKASRSLSVTPHSLGNPRRVTSTKQRLPHDNAQYSQEKDIHAPPGFERAIPGSRRPLTHHLGGAATWIGVRLIGIKFYISELVLDSYEYITVAYVRIHA